MLINIHHDSPAEHRRLLVSGVVFLTVLAALIALSIAIYSKAFDRSPMITVQADRAGLQLAKFGDVRLNGALVGQVREIEQVGDRAEIKVALTSPDARDIPDNVRVDIVPTTLFGQKFLAFDLPEEPSEGVLEDGDVIPADQVRTNVELSDILADLFPLLRAVRPADLNYTLSAIANALEGRGDKLGTTFDDLDEYLDKIEGSLPTLKQDLVKLAQVADTYDLAAPDLLDVLRNLTVTSRTVTEKRADIDTFFADVGGLAVTSRRILSDNGNNIIEVGRVTEPFLRLLAVYAPEYPCLLKGAARYSPVLSKSFEGNEVKQYIEFGTRQYRNYDERDLPEYGEVGRGPWCSGLPNPPVPIGPVDLKDGSNISSGSNIPGSQDSGTRMGTRMGTGSGTAAPSSGALSSGSAGSPAEQAVLNALLAATSGGSADSYGALGSLLYGPVVRGSGS